MNIEQTVRAAFVLREPAQDFEDAVMARLAAGAWRTSQAAPRRRRYTLLVGMLLALSAAAAMLAVQLVSRGTEAISPVAAVVPPETSAMASPEWDSLKAEVVRDGAAVPTTTVLLVLEQQTGDATGRDFGQQVYERAREELRALPGVVLVDAGAPEAAAPAFRMTYFNRSRSGFGSSVRSDGLASTLLVFVEMDFKVEAFQSSGDAGGGYRSVFSSDFSLPCTVPVCGNAATPVASSVRPDMVSINPALPPYLPAGCIGRRVGRCPYTPADIAAYTVLSWRLKATPPDPPLLARLHAMVLDSSSPAGIWMMAFRSLVKYGKMRGDASGLLAEGSLNDDPELRSALTAALIKGSNGPDLMRLVQTRLPGRLSSTSAYRGGDSRARWELVKLLTTELRDEPATPGILRAVANDDLDFNVRAEARRTLSLPAEPPPSPPKPIDESYMGPIDEQ